MIAEDSRSVTISVLKMSQPIGEFYIGCMKAEDIVRIAHFDIRRLQENGIDQYLGIQRQLNEKRVVEIQRYTRTVDATFPSAIILSVDERCAELRGINCEQVPQNTLFSLTLRNITMSEDPDEPILFRQIARVLDGQHRIAGLEDYPGDFDVNVAIFVGLDIASQASVFSVVNLAQTKVNHSLVYDLFAYDQARSPEKTCHDVAVALDSTPGSPFHQRIKRLGVATEGRFGETLSQATFVRSLLPYITSDVMLDRDIGRRKGNWKSPNRDEAERMIFRIFFVNDRDLDIAQTLWVYFEAVAERWPESWGWTGSGRILNKSTGFEAMMRFLRPAYRAITSPGIVPKKEQFAHIFSKIKIRDSEFTTDVFKPGSSGTGALYRRMLDEANLTG